MSASSGTTANSKFRNWQGVWHVPREERGGMAGTQGATGKRRAKGWQGLDNLGSCRQWKGNWILYFYIKRTLEWL